ncbi:hypothetical protein TB2_037835 [Malus domestica]
MDPAAPTQVTTSVLHFFLLSTSCGRPTERSSSSDNTSYNLFCTTDDFLTPALGEVITTKIAKTVATAIGGGVDGVVRCEHSALLTLKRTPWKKMTCLLPTVLPREVREQLVLE